MSNLGNNLANKLVSNFISKITTRFPSLSDQLENIVSENLLSPFQIKVNQQVIDQAKQVIKSVNTLICTGEYKALFQIPFNDPKNRAILNSFDFHLTDSNELKLIEINTNASFLGLGHFMNLAHGLTGIDLDILKSDILNELKLFGNNTETPKIAIVDESPHEQKLFSEFLVFNELFKSWGWNSQIKDISMVDGTEDFIYNRSTDFYFENAKSEKIKKFYSEKKICISPHPYEYFLIADKERLIKMSQDKLIDLPQLPYCSLLTAENADEIWAKRKSLFFKPLRSFGAKQSYRGASIARGAFDAMKNGEFIAQEYIPAGKRDFETPTGKQEFKFDLRFYAYQDKLEFVVARLYQGQVTNLKTPYGGFAPVIIE